MPNYPNPFNPVTTLRFSLKEKAKVSLIIYDAKGRLVRTLIRPDKAMAPGKYRLILGCPGRQGLRGAFGAVLLPLLGPALLQDPQDAARQVVGTGRRDRGYRMSGYRTCPNRLRKVSVEAAMFFAGSAGYFNSAFRI